MAVDTAVLKEKYPLEQVISTVIRQELNRQNKIFAPWRDENTPSLHVYDNGTWHDFAEGIGGDLFDLLGYFWFGRSYDRSHHFLQIVDRLGELQVNHLPAEAQPRRQPEKQTNLVTLDMQAIMDWHFDMPDERRAFWHGRGLTNETINHFVLGWDGKAYTIPAFYRGVPFAVKRRIDPESLVRAQESYERITGAICEREPGISKGELGRRVGPPPCKYYSVKGSTAGLFNVDILLENRWCIICEGEIDAMLLWQLGYPAVSSTNGAGSFPLEWVEHFLDLPYIFLLFDNDRAGELGAKKVKGMIYRAKVLKLPSAWKDVGELITLDPNPREWLRENILNKLPEQLANNLL